MVVSGETVGQMIAAALVALLFLGIALHGWRGSAELTNQANAAIDARRTAQAVEVADQKEQAVYRLDFRASYDSIELESDRVVLTLGGVEAEQRIYPHEDVATGSVSGDRVCVVSSGGETRLTGCGG